VFDTNGSDNFIELSTPEGNVSPSATDGLLIKADLHSGGEEAFEMFSNATVVLFMQRSGTVMKRVNCDTVCSCFVLYSHVYFVTRSL